MKRGVLLVNLGSPDSPNVADVRRYLHQFLMDPHVMDLPYLMRKLIVCGTILPKRQHASAEAYRAIWTDEGSPLILMSKRICALLQERLEIPVALGMRYGNPSIRAALRELQLHSPELQEIFLIPLYPHYAMSSVETAVVETKRQMQLLGLTATLRVHEPFYDDPRYIAVLVERSREYLHWHYDHLLFSYHGLPERHLKKSDATGIHCLSSSRCCFIRSEAHKTCYRHQVYRTTEHFLEEAGIDRQKTSVAFQSRLGKDSWLTPYTDHELIRLAESGVKRLLVISPAFVADCLETLEEIDMRGRELFLGAGGEEFRYIPCLNDHPAWVEILAAWVSMR